MGARADFYVGRGTEAEWLGSVAMDGYPDGFKAPLLTARTEAAFRREVAAMLAGRDDATTPEMGWPWPWENSGTTDYAYAFDGGWVYGSCFGGKWFEAWKPQPDEDDEDGPKVPFPDMSARKNVAGGKRSGMLVLRVPR